MILSTFFSSNYEGGHVSHFLNPIWGGGGGGGGGRNLPELTLNADISITVTAMTLKFHEFQFVAMTIKV